MSFVVPPTLPEFGLHRTRGLLLVHAFAIPAMLALTAMTMHLSGLDDAITESVYERGLSRFPVRDWAAIELIGHRVAKSAVFVVWFLLLAAAVAAQSVQRLARYRTLLWATALAMAVGPTVVALLKDVNAIHCPWDLKRFGGSADVASAWFVTPADAGRCFPAGHAAGGFSLAALYFAGVASGCARLRRAGLLLAIGTGLTFSAVRVIQGAHFASHNLWSAAIDWSGAALVFALFAAAIGRARRDSPAPAAG